MGCSGGMEPDEDKSKLNDDAVLFVRKRSETAPPRYSARLHAYVDLKRKRSRAYAARRRIVQAQHCERKQSSSGRKKGVGDANQQQLAENSRGDKNSRSIRSRSEGPGDRCGRRRRSCPRRRRSRRRRRRSCRRRRRSRRRRRRSCRRRSRRRRRRRSCRRRRRRSCRRRRRRSRRRRRCR